MYGVYSDEAHTVKVGEITTGEDGTGTLTGLPLQDYYWVQEITPSKGFELDEVNHKVTPSVSEPSVTVSSAEYPKNDPMSITITKTWSGRTTPTIPTLAGTQFTVKYYDNHPHIFL